MLLNLQSRLHSDNHRESCAAPQPCTSQSKPSSAYLGSRVLCGTARLWSLLGVHGANATLDPLRNTHFFAALLAPYNPVEVTIPQSSAAANTDDNRSLSILRDDVRPSDQPLDNRHRASSVRYTRALSLREIPLYVPDEPWAWLRGCHIDNRRVLQKLGAGAMCTVSLMTGTVNGRPITYINKSWALATQQWQGFFSELALLKGSDYLRPLQGDVVPRLLTVQVDVAAVSLIMQIPHDSFWIEASEDMPHVLKERCIAALRKVHSHGVLHGDIELRHLLIGGDGKVTLIDFQESRARTPIPGVNFKKAEDFEFAMECRKLKSKLGYGNARDTEGKKCFRWHQRRQGERQLSGGEIAPEHISEDDVSDSPPAAGEWEARWTQPVSKVPSRFVVPGQTQEQLGAALDKFVTDLQIADSRLSRGLGHGRPRRCGLSTYPLGSAPTVTRRKRKSPIDAEITLPSPKRACVHSAGSGPESHSLASSVEGSVTHRVPLVVEPARLSLHSLTQQRTYLADGKHARRPKHKRGDEPRVARCESPVQQRKFYCAKESPRGTLHALGRDFLQLRKGKERYRILDSREFFLRQARRPAPRASPTKGILKPPRSSDFPPGDLEATTSEELDRIIDQAIGQAMESERRTQACDPPTAFKRSREVVEAEQAAKQRTRFQLRFSGRPVIAGGARVDFSIPSIQQAYLRGYARMRRTCPPRHLFDAPRR